MGFVWFVRFVDDMATEKNRLLSWRERVAAVLDDPPIGGGEEIPEQVASTNQTNPQTPQSLRVGLLGKSQTNPQQTPDPCVISGCIEPIADGDLVYCSGHRRRADEGTLWVPVLPRQRLVRTGPNTWIEAEWCKGLCVNCDTPLAPGSVIACPEHQRQIDAMVMPWSRP